MNNVYTKELINHYNNPNRFGKMDSPDLTGEAINSLCGDELKVYIKNGDGVINDISFEGSGCAICIGVMSMIIDTLIGKKLADVIKIDDSFALNIIGMKEDSPRKRCATLSIEAIRNIK